MKDILDLKDGHLLVHPKFGPLHREDYLPKDGKVKDEHDGHFWFVMVEGEQLQPISMIVSARAISGSDRSWFAMVREIL
jgi:hypothetical protein